MFVKPRVKLNEGDERFVSEFKNYADLIVKESGRRILREDSTSNELIGAGRRLVEESKALGISENTENLVNAIDGLVKDKALTSTTDELLAHQIEHSQLISGLVGLKDYFEKIGYVLDFSFPVLTADGRHVLSMTLGEACEIKPADEPAVCLYTKLFIPQTDEQIRVNTTGGKLDSLAWANHGEIYISLEQFLNSGERAWRHFNRKENKWHRTWRSEVRRLRSRMKKGETFGEKLANTAWAPLFEKFRNDRAGFAKEYAKISSGSVLWHEGHHVTAYCNDREVAEAAAQLCQIAQEEMPLAALVDLYYWKRCKKPLYAEAAKIAFTYLEESGYSKTQLDAKPDGHHNGATGEAGLKNRPKRR